MEPKHFYPVLKEGEEFLYDGNSSKNILVVKHDQEEVQLFPMYTVRAGDFPIEVDDPLVITDVELRSFLVVQDGKETRFELAGTYGSMFGNVLRRKDDKSVVMKCYDLPGFAVKGISPEQKVTLRISATFDPATMVLCVKQDSVRYENGYIVAIDTELPKLLGYSFRLVGFEKSDKA